MEIHSPDSLGAMQSSTWIRVLVSGFGNLFSGFGYQIIFCMCLICLLCITNIVHAPYYFDMHHNFFIMHQCIMKFQVRIAGGTTVFNMASKHPGREASLLNQHHQESQYLQVSHIFPLLFNYECI